MDKIIRFDDAINEELLLEMANAKASDTGLPYDLWLDPMGSARNNSHNGPRVKVKVDGELIPIEISDSPDIPESVKKTGRTDFKHKALVCKYIKAYKGVLLAHFNQQISDKQVLNLLSTIDKAPEAELKLSDFTNAWPNLRIEFKWNDSEVLYEIAVVCDNGVLEKACEIDNFEFFTKMNELQQKYTCHNLVNLGDGFKVD